MQSKLIDYLNSMALRVWRGGVCKKVGARGHRVSKRKAHRVL